MKLADLGAEAKIISPRLMFKYREKMMKWYKKSQILSYKLRNGMPLKEKKGRGFWEWSDVLTHAYYNDHSFTRSLLRFREFYAANPELQLRLIERTLKVLAISHRKKVQSLVRKTVNADL